MKAEKFARLILENCLTKKGAIYSTDYNMLYHLCFFSMCRKHTFRWVRSHGHVYANDSYIIDTNLLKKLGIKFEILNDAPRGGKNGECIIITANSRRRIKPFIDELKKYCEEKYGNEVYYRINYNTLLDAIKKIAE